MTRAAIPAALAVTGLALVAGCAAGGSAPRSGVRASADASTTSAGAHGSAAGLRLRKLATFDSPTYVASPPRDARRIFVVERQGTIRVIRGGRRLSRPFADLRTHVQGSEREGERGLLSMAFAPDYRRSRLLYVYFTAPSGDVTIAELRRSKKFPDRVDPGSYRVVLTQEHRQFANHNGGQLQFGPDGLLYAGLGDGGDSFDTLRSGQNLGTLLGKLIRIDPRSSAGKPYSVPDSNPFVHRSGARPEIYSYGLRNPWRFSFDRAGGNLVIADVGQNEIEEVDFVSRGEGAGLNFGWSCFEGSKKIRDCQISQTLPVLELSHSDGYCSITGGYIVRDRALGSLFGRYVYGDFCNKAIRSVKLAAGARGAGDASTGLQVEATSSFGEDACGHIYIASLSGAVYRLLGPGRPRCPRGVAH